MAEYIIKSRAVFDGRADSCKPLAVWIKDDRIKKLLPYDETNAVPADVPIYDMGDKLVMPSFIDAHTHIFTGAVAASEYVCNTLDACHSEQECVEQMAAYVKAHPGQKRIRGTGWFIGNWTEDRMPDKRSLDGELTGMLIEPEAYAPAMEKFMDFTDEEMTEIHRHFKQVLAENGVAGLSEMFAEDYTEETYKKYELLKKLDDEEGLYANVYVYTKLFGYTSFEKFFEMKEKLDSRHFQITGLKGFIDGVTETYTGLLLEPYTDRPDTCGEKLPLWPRAKMQEEITAANEAGIQVRLHCIADGSVRMALDMYEEAEKRTGRKDLRNTIEHIENIHPDDIRRFKELDVVASMQPYHLILSNNDKIVRLGKKRCRYEWPMKSITNTGAAFAVGTDYPVVGLDPFQTIYAAVTRKDADGRISGQNPWEAIDMATVLKGYTYGAAYVYQAEDRTGSIEEGKCANLIVLDQNLFTIDPEKIPDTKVVWNILEGQTIYDRLNNLAGASGI